MCGALAISAPPRSNRAQEKSSRSLMLTEEAVFWSATPISSATAMNRLLNTSSMTGSTSVPMAWAARRGGGAGEDEVAERVDLGLPAGLDDGGGGGVDDEGRAGDEGAGGEVARSMTGIPPLRFQGRGTARSVVEGSRAGLRQDPSTRLRLVPLPANPRGGTCPTASTIAVSITTAVSRRREAEPRPVRLLERRPHRLETRRPPPPGWNRCLRSAAPPGAVSVDRLHPLAPERRLRLVRPSSRQHRLRAPRPADAALPQLDHVGQAHAVGAEHPGERVDHHPLHAERVGDEAGMLAAGAAEAGQSVAGDVVAAGDRDLLDRARHIVDRDPDEACRRLARPTSRPRRRSRRSSAREAAGVDRLVAARRRRPAGNAPAGSCRARRCSR